MADPLSPFAPPDTSTAEPEEEPAAETEQPVQPATPAPAQLAPATLSPTARAYATTAMHLGGYSDEQVAGMLGTRGAESHMQADARNPTTGAEGLSQDLGSRQQGLHDYAKATGQNPDDPSVQATFDIMQMHGRTPGYSDERPAGAALWNSKTPQAAADTQVHDFERPGAAAEGSEIPLAEHYASQALPAVRALRAELAAQAQPAGTGDAEEQAAAAKFRGILQAQSQDGGAFDHVSAPTTVQPLTQDPELDAARKFLAISNGAKAPGTLTPSSVADALQSSVSQDAKSNFGTLGHALSTIPGGLVAGASWLPTHLVDGWNMLQHFYTEHPDVASSTALTLDGMGPPMPPGIAPTIDPNTGGVARNPHQQDAVNQLKAIPVLGPILAGEVPGGSEQFAKWAQAQNIETRNPREYGDTNILDGLAYDAANLVGASFQPVGVARGAIGAATAGTVAAAGKSALGLLWRHVAEPALLAPGVVVGEDIAGANTNNPTAQLAAQAGAIPLSLGARGLMLAGAERGISALGSTLSRANAESAGQKLAGSAIDKAFLSQAGGDRAAADAAKAEASAQLGNPQLGPEGAAGLPEGTNVPAAARTSSAPLQALAFSILHRGDEVQNHFVTTTNPLNIDAANALRPQGDAQDVMQAVQAHQTSQQQLLTARIGQSVTDARIKMDALSQGTRGQQLVPGDVNGEVQRAQALLDELGAARDDSKSAVDDAYGAARDQGQLDAKYDSSGLYRNLEQLTQQSIIRGHLPGDMPLAQLSSMYRDGDPRSMFDPLGNRRPGTQTGDGWAGKNATFGTEMSIDRGVNLEQQLTAAISQESDKLRASDGSGSRIRLSNLVATKAAVRNWVDDAAENNGNLHTLLTARSAAALHGQTFEQGPIADLLNRSSLVSPTAAVGKYLGDSQMAGQMADDFQQALQYRTGAAAIKKGTPLAGMTPGQPGPTPYQQSANAIADWLHQSYLNARTAGDKPAGAAWLRNTQPFFEKMQGEPTFDALQQKLQGHQYQEQHVLPQIAADQQQSLAEQQHSAAQLFLDGRAGEKLDAVLRGNDPSGGMQQLFDITRSSDNASQGLKGMLWDRAVRAGTLQSPNTLGATLSGRAIQQWMQKPGVATAYAVARREDPEFGQRLDQLVNGMALQDRISRAPLFQLPTEAHAQLGGPGNDLAQAVTKILAVRGIGGPLSHALGAGSGSIQINSIASNLAGKWFPRLVSGIAKVTGRVDPRTAAMQAMREAVLDPTGEKLRGLLAPVDGGPSQQKWSAGVAPWLRGLGIVAAQNLLTPAPPTPGLGEGTPTP